MLRPRAFRALAGLVVLLVSASLLPACTKHTSAPPSTKTIISLEFDDGKGQQDARAILRKHHMHGTFYINSGFVGTGNGYFTWDELQGLLADGNEIAGHTLTHRDMAALSADEQGREMCGDRKQLIEHGFRPVDFAYPFGSYNKLAETTVQKCGYQSGRAAWGLWWSGCESTPKDCPYAEDPSHLTDRWAILTSDAPIDLTYVANLKRDVTDAEQHGGGWVQIFWHRLCNDDCDEYSWDPALLDEFLTWLQARRSQGTVVMTPQEVLHERWGGQEAESAKIQVPPPPPPPAGSNLLRNADLESFDSQADAPTCWELSGGATWSRARGVSGKAERAVITGSPDGYAALAQPLDQGECAPAALPGQKLRFSVAYRSDTYPRIVVWARNPQGGWALWTDGPRLTPATSFRTAAWNLPPIPSDVTAVSIGVALNGDGEMTVDTLALTRLSKNG